MKHTFLKLAERFFRSIWLFPSILTVALFTLSILQINGSSIGVYHTLFYGNQPDKDLIANHPLPIRSDEWIVNTQKTIAQKNNGFNPINQNVGYGENETVLADAPSTDWSTFFKPHNIGFLVLPFNIAFALKWWILSYFLVISCYFFILSLIPNKKLLAVLVSLGFLFSPFLQWWYSSGTLGVLYYTFFALTAFMKLTHSRTIKQRVLWSALLAYIGVGFALIIYPPFQIPCLLVAIGFAAGFMLDSKLPKKQIQQSLMFTLVATLIAGAIVGVFLLQKRDVLTTISNTAYPGQRIVSSGGYSVEHLLSSQLSSRFEDTTQAAAYSRPAISATNPSESSNFILLLPFLVAPSLFLLLRSKNKTDTRYSLYITLGVSLLFLVWMLVPHLSIIGQLTLLNRVPHQRLLIGLGLANIIVLILFIKEYSEKKYKIPFSANGIYSLLVLIGIIILDLRVSFVFPAFLDVKSALILSVPFAVIVFCLLQKYFRTAVLLLCLFTIASSCTINPLYKTTDILTKTPISSAIQQLSNGKRWVSEEIFLENFATMNGSPSLTGTYLYPQLKLWDQLGEPSMKSIYNRYAHVSFTFDRTGNLSAQPILKNVRDDQFNIRITPCDAFFNKMNVGFLITSVTLSHNQAPCASLAQTVRYPAITYYIYRLSF